MKRRQFIQYTTAAAIAAGLPLHTHAGSSNMISSNAAKLPRRPYGKTGIELSIIGFGGLVLRGYEQDHANRVIAEAVERGVNYFDVAPTYGDAELRLGPALAPYRKDVFLACKTIKRDAAGSAAELKQTLERLGTDHVDVYQLHGITDMTKDVDAVFAKGGAMETFIAAKKDGRVRHIGFSAHSVEAALTAMDRFDFDSILFPVNFATYYKGNFGPTVLAKAKEKGVARLALKAMAKQVWPENAPGRKTYGNCWYEPLSTPDEALLGLKFTLGQDVTAALPPADERLWRLAMDLAPQIEPLTDAETAKLREMAGAMTPIFHT